MPVLKVKAFASGDIKWAGYYDHARRKPGDVFILKEEKHFSHRWMEAIGWNPEAPTDVQKNAEKDIIKPGQAKPIGARQTSKNKAMSGEAVSLSQIGGVSSTPTPIDVDFDDTSPNPPDEAI